MHARWVRPSSRVIGGASRPVVVAVSCLLFLCTGGSAAGQKLDKAADTWLKQYRMLVLPDEVKVLQQIKDPADVAEFERIFWARRNPAPPGSENPFKAAVDKARGAADERFSDTGRKGSLTGCGQVFMLLGDPDEVQGIEIRTTFEDRPVRGADAWRRPEPAGRNATRDGARRPETWTYKSNVQHTFLLPRGDLRLQFDSGCEFEEGARVMDELSSVAATRVLHPELQYEFGPNGRLRPLPAAAAPPPRPAVQLDQLRSDFAAEFEMKVQMPGQGGAYTAALLHGAAGALPPTLGGGKPVPLSAVARATPEAGNPVAFAEREVLALVQPDGSFVTSYGFALPPGRYSISIGLLEPTSGRSTVATGTVETPDYAGKALVVGPLVVLSGEEAAATSAADPYAAFVVRGDRLVPRLGNVLSQAESLRLLVLVHNATLDPSNNKASLRAAFSVLQDGKLVAKGKEQYFDTPGAAPEVGPIALTPFAPGRYLARVEITDEVTKTVVVRETPFEVRPPGPAR
jgi:GWxTD domain-containing protein